MATAELSPATDQQPTHPIRIHPEELNETDKEIVRLVRAKIPLVSIATYEPLRVLGQMKNIRQELIGRRVQQLQTRIDRVSVEGEKATLSRQLRRMQTEHPVLCWTCTAGLQLWEYKTDKDGQEHVVPRAVELPSPHKSTNPVAVLLHLLKSKNQVLEGIDLSTALFVFCDLHHWLDREDRMGRFNHMAVRAFRDLVQECKQGRGPSALILLSPHAVVPYELSNDIQVMDYPLPTPDQLEARFLSRVPAWKKSYGEECIRLNEGERKELVRALSGLTYEEAGNVLVKGLASKDCLEREDIGEALRQKRQIIQKDGTLDYFESAVDFESVGGLELLQQWLKDRRDAFEGKALTFARDGKSFKIDLPVPKGILLIGVPGGGKSLVAKAVGQEWKLPLLRLDIGRIFGSYIGESEKNMRNAIRVAESVAPAIVWLDEIEKAFPKVSSSTDSGVSVRVMSTFLTWMQERKKAVFVVATGNDISQLPAELSRKGRFDEIFYVGLPNQEAREQIFAIHTRHLPLSDTDHKYLAAQARWYTGAEIEQVVKNSFYRLPLFLAGRRLPGHEQAPDDPLVHAILDCMRHFIPLAKRKGEDGRGFVETILAKASLIATPASAHFEKPPAEDQAVGYRFDPDKIDTGRDELF